MEYEVLCRNVFHDDRTVDDVLAALLPDEAVALLASADGSLRKKRFTRDYRLRRKTKGGECAFLGIYLEEHRKVANIFLLAVCDNFFLEEEVYIHDSLQSLQEKMRRYGVRRVYFLLDCASEVALVYEMCCMTFREANLEAYVVCEL